MGNVIPIWNAPVETVMIESHKSSPAGEQPAPQESLSLSPVDKKKYRSPPTPSTSVPPMGGKLKGLSPEEHQPSGTANFI